MTPFENQIATHYEQPRLLERLLQHLNLYSNESTLTIESLKGFDEFHTGGARATELALDLLPLSRDMHVLDVGCGIGGAARRLAGRFGCRVTGIDITQDFVRIARILTKRIQLTEHCEFENASAFNTGCSDRAFNATVSFHVAMNIEARSEFYGEVARVTKPGGWFLSYDLVRGTNTKCLDFPLPWSSFSEGSFLKSTDETRALLEDCGFVSVEHHKLPELNSVSETPNGHRPINVLLGEEAEHKVRNHRAALADQRIVPVFFLARTKAN